MTALSQFFTFTEANFVNGQARLLYSLLGTSSDVSVPASPVDIFEQVSPYTPASGWVDLGGISTPPQYSSGRTLNEWKVQQQMSAVKRVPTDLTRTVKFTAAEVKRADILQMFENASQARSIAAVTGTSDATAASAFSAVDFGQYADLNEYRFAIAAFQPQDAGTVVEPGGASRPCLVVQVLKRVSLDTENSTSNWGIGEMVTGDITLKCLPEPGADQNTEHGTYFFETAGTIATS